VASVYLVDDGSEDGTGEAVRFEFPSVNVIQGDGSLFWGGGMRRAFSEAQKINYDFYIWLNDDVELDSTAITNVISNYERILAETKILPIVVGATFDPDLGKTSYGGRMSQILRPLNFKLIDPDETQSIPCDTMNGNFVLISREVAERGGNLDARFVQQLGDFDYGLRAKRAGISIWVAPGYVGRCKATHRTAVWKDGRVSFSQRLKAVRAPLGLPPAEFFTFAWRHYHLVGLLFAILSYRKLIFPENRTESKS
tara:strand:- start:8087 stop:8848 length:762 start_codon:yes stop_codon:yes gene_type:complete